MTDSAASDSKQPGKPEKKKRKRSLTFAEMMDRQGFSVPDEALKMYRQLQNPFAMYVQQLRAAGAKDVTIEWLVNLVNQNVGYYKRKLECLKLIADFGHAKPRSGAPVIPPPDPDAPPSPIVNPYANKTTDELLASIVLTDDHFDPGTNAPRS